MAESPRKKRREKSFKGFQHKEPRWKQQVKQIEDITSRYDDIKCEEIEKFSDVPLSHPTMEGLMKAGYARPTDIQKAAIPLALAGKDVLGAAKTGSGKTLAFLIPVLELLWRERWSQVDGLGALIISPTRELAYQTFEVLRRIGSSHDFSAGLVIGGHELTTERKQIQRTNIVVCTPGRLLQHMDETPDFQCLGLRILVLDETDRIMDLGFRNAMNSIVENLPTERQTLLFSATQTKSVKDLAMLSLNDPEYVSVHEESHSSTPYKLSQSYIVCELQDKLQTLFSFIKLHLLSKTIVFMSSCKQVKFAYEAFRRFQPGVPLMALYGRQKQVKRVAIYNDFSHKKAAVLFCTDIASRGLDFPSVDWVVQLDCPEDANTYIHRVGRTARYEKGGKALLFLLPSEESGMLLELQSKKIPIERIRTNPSKILNIQGKLSSLCAQDVQLKQWAQRSFICYVRSIHLQSNKKVFQVRELPLEEYALSLGLPQPPKVRFLKKGAGKEVRGQRSEEKESDANNEEEAESSEEDNDQPHAVEKGESSNSKVSTKFDSLGTSKQKKLSRIPVNNSKKLKKLAEDDILTVKSVLLYRKDDKGIDDCSHDSDEIEEFMRDGSKGNTPSTGSTASTNTSSSKGKQSTITTTTMTTKYAMAKKLLNKGIKLNKHVKFDSEDETENNTANVVDPPTANNEGESCDDKGRGQVCPISMDEYQKSSARETGGISIKKAKLKMKLADKKDRQRERVRVREEHLKRKRKIKQRGRTVQEEDGGIVGVALGYDDEDAPSDKDSDDDNHSKKRRVVSMNENEDSMSENEDELREDEELALHLLKS